MISCIKILPVFFPFLLAGLPVDIHRQCMTMAEPFSTAAAAIGIVDIVIKSAREISNIIASLRDAPEELLYACERVCEVQNLLEVLKRLENDCQYSHMPQISPQSLASIRRAAKSINDDLKRLRAKIDEPIFDFDSRTRRFLKSLRHLKGKQSIDRICFRLTQKISLIHCFLGTVGRY